MPDALVAGLLIGFGVAVFVAGPAMVMMETAVARGLGIALASGAGIATGDALWAAVAAGAGLALHQLLAQWATVLQWTAVGALVLLGVLGVRELVGKAHPAPVGDLPTTPRHAYGEFLAHTLGHPTTVVFFVSLIVGATPRYGAAEAAAFVVGVFLASLSWQWVLAAAGAWRRRPFSGRVRRVVLALDCVLLLLLIGYIALGWHRA